jgi:hypothetical protein
VGILHEINSDESTVSLENVRSFGTEGRKGKPEEEVAPSEQLYEYIVFRGTDVKDLRIEEPGPIKETKPPAIPDDPAIVGVSLSHTLYACWVAGHSMPVLMMKHSGCKFFVLSEAQNIMLIFPLPSF